MRIKNLLPLGSIIASTALFACGSNSSDGSNGVGGSNSSTGGTSSRNSSSTKATGGESSAPEDTGGASSTSTKATGGASSTKATGGASSTSTKATGGASSTSTKATGGASSTGTKATGGASSTGTKATGGASSTSTKATGGTSSTGTTATGGATTQGGSSSNVGGVTSTGGSSSSGTTGGSSSTGSRPGGYYYLSDWNVSTPDWHGCVWTGKDSNVKNSTTSVTPTDFLTVTPAGAEYRISGKVTADPEYQGVALLGFNIAEAITGDANQCKYDAAAASEDGPPDIDIADVISKYKGIAVNWTAKTKPAQFRIQLQAHDSSSDLAKAWCATIEDAQGPSFVKWEDFSSYCWGDDKEKKYAGEKIDAISFLVPGNTTESPFDFTIGGFAPGNSAADAPGKAGECGSMTGTLGKGGPSKDASMQRMAVTGTTGSECKKYVVFNNNWGQPESTSQTIDYTGNKFTVKSANGTNSGSGVPASFPCIYVGANGDLGGGTYNTWTDSHLPKKISDITSAQTTFTWTGDSKNYNATYDVWFSKNSPAAGEYNDAISGFIMVWLYKPSGNQPIGSVKRTASIAGHQWDVWIGPRGNTSTGTDPAGRPVVSYVAKDGPVKSLTFDLKAFMDDAVTNASSDMSAGGTSQAFSSSWYLTDVFAGFEAWTAADIVGNTAQMSIAIKP